ATGAQNLDVTPVAKGAATATGAIDNLAPGHVDYTSIAVGLDTSTAGARSGYVNLVAASDGGNGNSAAINPYPIVDVFGSVYRPAAAAIDPISKIVHVGDPGTAALRVANAAAADGFSETLVASISGTTTGVSASGSSSTGLIAAGAFDASSLAVA